MVIGKPIYFDQIDLGDDKVANATQILKEEMLKLLDQKNNYQK